MFNKGYYSLDQQVFISCRNCERMPGGSMPEKSDNDIFKIISYVEL